MKLPFGEKSGQLAASPQRLDSLAVHVLLLTEAAVRFFPGQEFLWLYGSPGHSRAGRGGCSGTTPGLSCAPARPSHRSRCASTGRARSLGSAALSWPCHPARRTDLGVHPSTLAVACAAPAPRAAPCPPCPGARFVKVLYPPLICLDSRLSPPV